ncbi:MAG: hypothetical protein ACRDOI_30130 [Trebonia sp.]
MLPHGGGPADRYLPGSRAADHPSGIRFLTDDTAIVVSEGGIIYPGQDAVASEGLVRATRVLAWQDGRPWLAATALPAINVAVPRRPAVAAVARCTVVAWRSLSWRTCAGPGTCWTASTRGRWTSR